jgi:hypothetical protein
MENEMKSGDDWPWISYVIDEDPKEQKDIENCNEFRFSARCSNIFTLLIALVPLSGTLAVTILGAISDQYSCAQTIISASTFFLSGIIAGFKRCGIGTLKTLAPSVRPFIRGWIAGVPLYVAERNHVADDTPPPSPAGPPQQSPPHSHHSHIHQSPPHSHHSSIVIRPISMSPSHPHQRHGHSTIMTTLPRIEQRATSADDSPILRRRRSNSMTKPHSYPHVLRDQSITILNHPLFVFGSPLTMIPSPHHAPPHPIIQQLEDIATQS